MRTAVIATALVVVACKGDQPQAEEKPRMAPRLVIDAPAAAPKPDAAPPPDAGPPDARTFGRPITAEALPEVPGATAGPIELLAVDAPAMSVVGLVHPERKAFLVVSGSDERTIRGRARGKTPAALLAALHAAFPAVPAPAAIGRGKAPDVDLSFRGAPVVDLYRLFSDIEHRNYVLAPTAAAVDVVVKRVPSDATSAAITALLGYQLEAHGNVTYVRTPDAPPLDAALIARGGPVVDVDLHQARAGEAYAAMALIGADVGGAPCGEGAPIDLRLRKVNAGVAAAVIAALGGVAPVAGARCTLPDAERVKVTGLRGIVTMGKARAAVVDDATGPGLLYSATPDADGIGAQFVELGPGTAGQTVVPLYPASRVPDDYPSLDQRPAWTNELEHGRLALTLIDGKRRVAVIEMPDGTWRTLGDDVREKMTMKLAIEPGRVSYTFLDDPAMPPTEHVLVLRER